MWSQLLNQVSTVGDVGGPDLDSVFVRETFDDRPVEAELVDAGRTAEQVLQHDRWAFLRNTPLKK
jgi:hypothetical protein